MQIISIPATIVTAVGDYNVQELEAEGVVYNFHSSPCLKGSSDFTSLMEIITSLKGQFPAKVPKSIFCMKQ